jgi:hypothetical protein
MKIYHSFWEGGYKVIDENLYNMHKLSVLTALKNYGNITLITTKKGKEIFGDLPYTNIELFEKEIPIGYRRVWSLSKLFAYQQICKKNEPFLHIDYDVFLFKKFSDETLKGGIICQSIEDKGWIETSYRLNEFNSQCKNKYLYKLHKDVDFAYNVGVFGGSDIQSINFYVDEALKLLFDKENKHWWINYNVDNWWVYAVILEQFYLAVCLKHLNVEQPTLIFPKDYLIGDEQFSKKIGYTHLMGQKNVAETLLKVKNKIKQYESI